MGLARQLAVRNTLALPHDAAAVTVLCFNHRHATQRWAQRHRSLSGILVKPLQQGLAAQGLAAWRKKKRRAKPKEGKAGSKESRQSCENRGDRGRRRRRRRRTGIVEAGALAAPGDVLGQTATHKCGPGTFARMGDRRVAGGTVHIKDDVIETIGRAAGPTLVWASKSSAS